MHYKHCQTKFEDLELFLNSERKKLAAHLKSYKYAKIVAIGFALIGGLTMSLGEALMPLLSLMGGCSVLLFIECSRYVERAYCKINIIEGTMEYLSTFKNDVEQMIGLGELNTIESGLEVVSTLNRIEVNVKTKMASL